MHIKSLAAAALAGACLPGSVLGLTINVDFAAGWSSPDASYVSPAGPETAGYWNRAATGNRAIRDRNLAFPSGVLASYHNPWANGAYLFAGGGLGDVTLAYDFRYTVTGLAEGYYDVFVYGEFDSPMMNYTVNGTQTPETSGILNDPIDWAHHRVFATGGVISLMNFVPPEDRVPQRIPVFSGLQITSDLAPVPLPASGILLGSVLLGGVAVSRRRRRNCS